MQFERQPKKTGLVALLVIGWSLLGIAFPLVYSLEDRRTTAVYAAPRDIFTVAAPVSLGAGLSVERANLVLVDRVQPGTTVESLLAGGRATIAIEGGHLSFDARNGTAAPDDYPAPFISAIAAGQFEKLLLRRSRVSLVLADGRSETLTNVTGEIVNRRRGGLSFQGSAEIRHVAHAIELQIGSLPDRRAGGRVPIRLSLKGDLLSGSLEGRAAIGEPFNVQGTTEFAVANVRATARAFGLDVGDGPAAGSFKARGRLDWARAMISVDKGTFVTDAGEATGTLSLDSEQRRPVLAGTLAFKTFDLTRLAPAILNEGEGFSWTDFTRGRGFLPFTRDLDVDVRLSAAGVKAGFVDLGETGATLSIKDGRLNAEMAELEVAGAKGSAQVSGDVLLTVPRFNWRLKLAGLESGPLAQRVAGLPLVSGPSTLSADLTTEGLDPQQPLRTARGSAQLRIAEGGRVGLDLRQMFNAAGGAIPAWDQLIRSQTAVDTLDVKLNISGQQISADLLFAATADARYDGNARFDRQTGQLEARLKQIRERSGAVSEETVRLAGDATRPDVSRVNRQPGEGARTGATRSD